MIEEIGQKIRNLRTASELTQEELARRAGLTDGFISQVERGRTSISIDSLKMLLDALNVSLADFFMEEKHEPIVFGKDDRVELENNGAGQIMLLIPGAANRVMEPALLKLPADTSTSLRSPFDGDSYGYVIRGRINLDIGKERIRVITGESFYFTVDREYRISNPFRREAEVLWVMSPPNF